MVDNKWEFKSKDIFENIEDDDENILMKIPKEIKSEKGCKEGDNIKILLGDQGTIIIEKI